MTIAKKSRFVAIATASGNSLGYFKSKKEVNRDCRNEGICGGEASRQPCITEEGKCDLCEKKVGLAEEEKKEKKEK